LADEPTKANPSKRARSVIQCGIATVIIFFILLWLDVLLGPSIVASLGATSFIVFAMPGSRAARPRSLAENRLAVDWHIVKGS